MPANEKRVYMLAEYTVEHNVREHSYFICTPGLRHLFHQAS